MEFAIIAYDGTDDGALERRMAVRDAHMALIRSLREKGNMTHGGALLDDAGKMMGSIIITQFPDRAAFDAWYHSDPYVTGGVWKDVQVFPFKTAEHFMGNLRPIQGAAQPVS